MGEIAAVYNASGSTIKNKDLKNGGFNENKFNK
jgi:hypothetical protein